MLGRRHVAVQTNGLLGGSRLDYLSPLFHVLLISTGYLLLNLLFLDGI